MSKRVGRPGDGLASDRPGAADASKGVVQQDMCVASACHDVESGDGDGSAGRSPVARRPSPSARFRIDTPPILLAGVASITTAAMAPLP
ncbi:hypothetical protein CSOJ01_01252 [Colletotrichum sojae]|uniref:Uncharacterized protein n=1 Tax=Colletotrichum sojae TaxID=2175907 RepID=A0A8H6JUD7_9PEZI|nr:hypothetical protein CSOJ01_01252 [Colletotrichum sojae]